MLTGYLAIKALHVVCVALSIAGFVARSGWRFSGRPLRRRGWPHWLPHLNDTILLAAAMALTILTGQYPVRDAWLTAKLAGLLAYIGFGWVALRSDASLSVRWAAWLAAVAAFAYVVSVALARDPLGFLVQVG